MDLSAHRVREGDVGPQHRTDIQRFRGCEGGSCVTFGEVENDVVDAGLSAIFGTLLSEEGAFCKSGELPLCTDNVSAKDEKFESVFPYLGKPTL